MQIDAFKQAAPTLGLTLLIKSISGAEEIRSAIEAGVEDGVEGLFLASASIFVVERLRITQLAAQHRLPAIYHLSSHVTEADGLMAYHFDEPAVHKNASSYVDKILKGARPSDLPVQQPSKFRLIINMKTAKSLGLVVPAAILARADEVIE